MSLEPSGVMAERMLVLTLALEAALREDNFQDAQVLFDERSNLIDLVGQNPPSNNSTLARIIKINKRIELAMVEKSQRIAAELRKGIRGKQAHRAYRPLREPCAAPDSHA